MREGDQKSDRRRVRLRREERGKKAKEKRRKRRALDLRKTLREKRLPTEPWPC
jgi:hypothetical protein